MSRKITRGELPGFEQFQSILVRPNAPISTILHHCACETADVGQGKSPGPTLKLANFRPIFLTTHKPLLL